MTSVIAPGPQPVETDAAGASPAAGETAVRQALSQSPRSPAPSSPAADGANRRGPFRPRHLVSPRARFEAAVTERTFRSVEAAAVLALAFVICATVQPHGLLAAPVADVLPFAAGAPVLIFCLAWIRAYSIDRREPLRRSLARASGALLLTGALVGALAAVLPLQPASAAAAGRWFAFSASAVFLLHLFWWRRVEQLRREGKLTPNVVFVGATPNAEKLIALALRSGEVAVLGVFDDRLGRAPGDVGGVPVLGDTAALLSHRIMPYVDRVVITVPSRAQGRVRQLIERLRVLPNPVSLFLDIEGEI
jgi:FlaA1/EpsC-like NDP-sugar epimerase